MAGDQIVGFMLGFTAVSPSEKLSLGVDSLGVDSFVVDSFDDGFAAIFELLLSEPPSAKLSLGGVSLDAAGFAVFFELLLSEPPSVKLSLGACSLLLIGAGFSLLAVD